MADVVVHEDYCGYPDDCGCLKRSGREQPCDGSMVCLAGTHLTRCRSQMSRADLDASEGRVPSCTCEPLLSQEGVCRVHDPVAASFIEGTLPRLLDEFEADKAAGRLSGRRATQRLPALRDEYREEGYL